MTPRLVETDVLVIGSGVAGLAAALAVRENGKQVLVVSKGSIAGHSCSWFAGGQLSLHLPVAGDAGIKEWLAGSPLTDRSVARALAVEAPLQIRNLARHGLSIRGTKSGGYAMDNARAGHAFSGITMVTRMTHSARSAGVNMLAGFTSVRLLVFDNRCAGAIGFTGQGEFLVIAARAVVLASGGACRMFQHTTNPSGITGDGYAMLLHAGAELVNVEFIRFFPLGLPGFRFPVHRPFRRFYDIEGLRTVNARGEDIFRKHLSMSIKQAMENTYCRFVTMSSIVAKERRSGEVLLDFTQVPAKIWSRLKSLGPKGLVKNWGGSAEMWLSILKDRSARTAPIAQTFVGGARVRSNMATQVAGLFACGEVVNFHFDLSSVPPCEIGPLPCALTSGSIAGKHAARASARTKKVASSTSAGRRELKLLQSIIERKEGISPKPIMNKIRKIMSLHCGALRSGASLREGLNKLNLLEPRMARFKISGRGELSQAVEAQNMALIASAVLHASLMREESRSEHFREDFPAKDDGRWLQSIVIELDRNKALSLRRKPTRNA
jgi:succinate dehydrogenase / fumarate reductase flavoprotein subunit